MWGRARSTTTFATKEELFDTAVMAVVDLHGAMMDGMTADIDDPAEAFAQSFRLTGGCTGSSRN